MKETDETKNEMTEADNSAASVTEEGSCPEETGAEAENSSGKKSNKAKTVWRIIFLLLGNAVVIAGVWQHILFNGVSVASMIFQLMVPMEGADAGNFFSLNIAMGIGLPLMTAFEFWLGNFWRKKTTKPKFLHKRKVLSAGLFFALAAIVVLAKMRVFSFLWRQMTPSKLYETHYVAPQKEMIKAPEKKRNLVYIYMESMENTYADKSVGGLTDKSRIPYLTSLALGEGECFSVDGKLNGLEPAEGAVWTCGSLVSQTCGTPLIVPIGRNNMGKGYKTFLPGMVSIWEILSDYGYRSVFLQGSKIEFAGTDLLLSTHGNPIVRDYNYYNKNHRLPFDGYEVWWGYEDFRLYEFAKEEILTAAESGDPFAVTIMTIDTHFTGGYTCPKCGNEFKNSYDNAILCADHQVEEFVTWLKQQPFYEDTTVVIVGDHPTMDSLYYRNLSKGVKKYDRKAYAVILNSALEYTLGKNRDYCAFDMYPTTLAAMGFSIEGNKLGLGVNLYSDEQTLCERYGLKKLNRLLQKKSKYYNKHIIEGK